MDVKGIITKIFDKKTGTSSKGQWVSQQFLIETEGQYPKHIVFNVFGEDKIARMKLTLNAKVIVSFDIDAHEYQGKWFPQIQAWQINYV